MSQEDGTPALELHLDGKLEFTTLAVDNTVIRSIRFDGVSELYDGPQRVKLPTGQALADALAVPAYALWAPSGQLQELRFARGSMRMAQTTLRAILTAVQTTRETGLPEPVTERDASGTYEARYTLLPDGRLEKRKLRYVEPPGRTTLTESLTWFRFTAGAMDSAEARESGSVTAQPPVSGMRYRWSLKLGNAAASRTTVQSAWRSELDGLERLGLTGAGTESSKLAEIDRQVIGDATLPSVLALLLKTPDSKASKEAAQNAFRVLVSLLRTDSANLRPVIEHVAKRGPLRGTLLAALRDAGTPEAQAALLSFLETPGLTNEERLTLAQHLSLTRAPTREATDTLRRLTSDPVLGEQAVLGLGTHVSRLAESFPERSQQLLGELHTRLKTATTPVDRNRTLAAIGNAGQPASLPELAPLLSAPDEQTRIDAIHAHRHIPGGTADLVLTRSLQDASPAVRTEAARSLRDRDQTPALRAGLSAALTAERDANVLNRLLDAATLFASDPGVLGALSQLAQAATDNDIRQRAALLVEQARTRAP